MNRPVLFSLLFLLLIILITGCTSYESTSFPESPLPSPSTPAPTLVPDSEPPQILQSGVPVTDLSAAQGSSRFFQITVPIGMTSLDIRTSGGSGDLDLYVGRGFQPTPEHHQWRSTGWSNTEYITINHPTAENYFILLHGYQSFSGATLVATVTDEVAPTPTQDPEPVPTPPSPEVSPEDLQLIRQYGWRPGSSRETTNVIRWRAGTIAVYDESGFPQLGQILGEWNAVIGGTTRFELSKDSASPITVRYDPFLGSCGQGVIGLCEVRWRNYELIWSRISVLPHTGLQEHHIYSHEVGHAVGFGGHTSDGTLMDATYNESRVISQTVRRMLQALYSLPIGHPLTRISTVPPDGSAAIPIFGK